MSQKLDNSNTLLAYALETLPSPLQASPQSGNTVFAALTFSISNNSAMAVSLHKLQFQLPVGTLAQDLTTSTANVLCGASPAAAWNISIDEYGVCTAVPSHGESVTVTTDGIIMQLYNIPVNQQTGTVSIVVEETASTASSPLQKRSMIFDVAKFPYGFFFANFTPQLPLVQDGGTVTLIWQGSDNATYTMLWNDQQVDVTNLRTWTSPPLKADTTFLLRATVQSLGETVKADLTTTVVVSMPDLQGSSLLVSGLSSLQGNTTIGAAGTTTQLDGTTRVNGSAVFSGPTTLDGAATAANLTVNQALSVSGAANLNGATVSGQLSAGSATANALTVNGAANLQTLDANTALISQLLTLSGKSAMLSNVRSIGPGTYTADTDMFITLNVSSSVAGQDKKSYAWARLRIGNQYVNCAGGNVYGPGKKTYSLNGAVTGFVKKGEEFEIIFTNDGDNEAPCWFGFYVWSIGPSNVTSPAADRALPDNEQQRVDQSSPGFTADLEQVADLLFEAVERKDKKLLVTLLRKLVHVD